MRINTIVMCVIVNNLNKKHLNCIMWINIIYYSTICHHLVEKVPLNSPGVTVWGGSSTFRLFGPVFIERIQIKSSRKSTVKSIKSKVNQENELEMLQERIVPELGSIRWFSSSMFKNFLMILLRHGSEVGALLTGLQ